MWDERYGDAEYAYGKEPNDFLVKMIDQLPRGDILCLCDGEGRNGVYLAQQGCRVTSVDASSVGLAKAQKLAAERGVQITTQTANLADFHIQPDRWDGIVSIFCHLPPVLRVQVHRQCVSGLRHGGIMLLEAYTPKQLEFKTGGPQVAEMTMTLSALRQELAGLNFNFAQECERDVQEGKYHFGRGAVVQLLATRS